MRRKSTGYRDGCYSVIAGHVEARESVTNAMIREAKEEPGIVLKPKWLKLIHVIHRFESQEREYFFFKVLKYLEESRIMEDKADDLRWFPLKNLPENAVPYVRQAIEMIAKRGEIF
ncbi:NUDIX domain-containing protein [Acidianus sp. DSM 29099]|nr:NUDIX domain-containing protein [Acidianus sp. RZ1]